MLPVLDGRVESVERNVPNFCEDKVHRIDVFATEEIADNVEVPPVDRRVKGIDVDGNVGEPFHDPRVDVLVPALDCSAEDAFVGVDLRSQSRDDVVAVEECSFLHFGRGDLRFVTQEEVYDVRVPLLDCRSEKGAILGVLSVVNIGARILEETLGEEAASLLDRPTESMVDPVSHGGMRACEDLFHLVHAIVADEVRELVDVVLRLDLAKHDVLVGGTVHSAQESCDFREVVCNELAYELHVRLMHFSTDHDVFV